MSALVSHYEDYPYPNPDQYGPEEVRKLRADNAPRAETWEQWFPGETPGRKRVLVVGCGVYEALAIAAQEPLLDVLGIDASKRSIEIAQSLADLAGVANVRLEHRDFMLPGWPQEACDILIASGVMHHIDADWTFLRYVGQRLARGGQFVVMVYGDQYREFVPPFCQMLRMLGIKRDAHGIKFVRGLIGNLPSHHPVKAFWQNVNQYDSQVVDLWLHPFFRQYGAGELIGLVERNAGLKFRRWVDPIATDFSIFEELPAEFRDVQDRFAALPYATKCRIGQVFGHADPQLRAVFVK